jgi:hypothetical protein
MSKAMATIATQPLIVAKVGLQSKPPPERNGKAFKSFTEVMAHIVEHEGIMRLFKGIGPQLLKGILVQGLLMLSKERYVFAQKCCVSHTDVSRIEVFFLVLYRSVLTLRAEKLAKLAEAAKSAQLLPK